MLHHNSPSPSPRQILWLKRTICFYYFPSVPLTTLHNEISGSGNECYILSKEGAQSSPPLGTQAGGDFSTDTSGALDITTTPSNPAYPYRVYIKDDPTTEVNEWAEPVTTTVTFDVS